jgi:hypothetical protein
MFDEIQCLYPLPLEGANARVYQTKDTPAQFTDLYEIREDGTLWHENYDLEDQSDPTKTGIERIFGMCARVNERWEPVDFTGEIRFYDLRKSDPLDSSQDDGWIEWSAYLEHGKVVSLNLIENR